MKTIARATPPSRTASASPIPPIVSFFNVVGRTTWLATEIDDDGVMFRFPLGLDMERDLCSKAPFPVGLYRGRSPRRLARFRRASPAAQWIAAMERLLVLHVEDAELRASMLAAFGRMAAR